MISNLGTDVINESTSTLRRYLPKPVNTVFQQVLRAAGQVAESTTGISGVNSEYQEIINKQVELQQQLLLVSMQSNISKAKHDTQMASVRNMRVS